MHDLAPGYLTDVDGLSVGHADDAAALTGCTVVLCPQGVTAGGEVRGLAPGTRETDLLRPGTLVEQVHAVLLTGGSAFGLAAADGVMRFLEERSAGYPTGVARVPIVPAAVLFDLELGSAAVRPDAAMGYRACQAAISQPGPQGNVGAGMGATVGKVLGLSHACKGGLGSASRRVGRLVVSALFAVNAFGDVLDPADGHVLAGVRAADGTFANASTLLASPLVRTALLLRHTVIGVVASNARLDVAQTNRVASAAHDGLARVVRPAHTLFDGDTVFALSAGSARAHLALVCELAAEVTSLAIANAVRAAEPAGGLPSARALSRGSPAA